MNTYLISSLFGKAFGIALLASLGAWLIFRIKYGGKKKINAKGFYLSLVINAVFALILLLTISDYHVFSHTDGLTR